MTNAHDLPPKHMAVICTTLNALREHEPDKRVWAKLLAYLGKTAADDEPLPLVTILEINGLDNALWALRAVTGEEMRMRRYAVWCARQVQHLMTDPRSLAALDVAEHHANGLVWADDELRAADAAAAKAAEKAASPAALLAAWAARCTTEPEEAWAAAKGAAWNAAWAAGWAETADATQQAARNALRGRQVARFREVFGTQEVG